MPEHEKAETPLDKARRHVDAGRDRIARQEQLIAELDRDGHASLAQEAQEIMQILRRTQALAEDDLARRKEAVKHGHRDGSLAGPTATEEVRSIHVVAAPGEV